MHNALARLLVSFVFFLLSSGSSYSEEVKIGFVSIERLVREAPASILAGRRIEAEFSARVAEIRQMATELTSKRENLIDKAVTFLDSQRRLKENELNELDLLLQRRQRALQEDIQARQTDLTSAILVKGNEVIKQIAEREKFDMVIQDAAWASPAIDITDRVIRVLANDN